MDPEDIQQVRQQLAEDKLAGELMSDDQPQNLDNDEEFGDSHNSNTDDDMDLYAMLNVPRDASIDQIKAAYKRLSMLYHPDKHHRKSSDGQIDTELQQVHVLEDQFMRVNTAYEILGDQQIRQMYDLRGMEGVHMMKDWQVGPQLKTAQELQNYYEYKRLEQKKQEVEQLNSTIAGQVEMTVDAKRVFKFLSGSTDADDDMDGYQSSLPWQGSYSESANDLIQRLTPKVESMVLQSNNEISISDSDTVSVGGVLLNKGIRGGGYSLLSWRRQMLHGRFVESTLQLGSQSLLSLGFGGVLNVSKSSAQVSPNQMQIPVMINCGLQFHHWILDCPPQVEVTLSRAISVKSGLVGSLTYKSGDWILGQWGRDFLGDDHQLQDSITASIERSLPQLGSTWNSYVTLGMLGMEVGGRYSVKIAKQSSIYTSVKVSSLSSSSLSIGYRQTVWDRYHSVSVSLSQQLDGLSMIKLKFTRYAQSFGLPIIVSDELNVAALLIAAGVPLIVSGLVRQLYIQPRRRKMKQQMIMEQKRQMQEQVTSKFNDLKLTVEAMKSKYESIVELERKNCGLIIEMSLYGYGLDQQLQLGGEQSPSSADEQKYIDCTAMLQLLVQDSKLVLDSGASKSKLMGLFDPCPWYAKSQRKQLYVNYMFNDQLHVALFEDKESVILPQKRHLIL
ncbi:hypothetical protein MP228_012792 [Amoeboaphelidium protococcarum]|nr:hypothetical protein MP228_012792 [Amoeboaphelidium protococcarum]